MGIVINNIQCSFNDPAGQSVKNERNRASSCYENEGQRKIFGKNTIVTLAKIYQNVTNFRRASSALRELRKRSNSMSLDSSYSNAISGANTPSTYSASESPDKSLLSIRKSNEVKQNKHSSTIETSYDKILEESPSPKKICYNIKFTFIVPKNGRMPKVLTLQLPEKETENIKGKKRKKFFNKN